MYSDPSCSVVFKNQWEESTQGQKVELITQDITTGKQGAAFTPTHSSQNGTMYLNLPHLTLMVNENFESKDLGPMMNTASKSEWRTTENPSIFTSFYDSLIKILCGVSM